MIFAVLVGIFGYISLGSIVATAAFPALVYFLDRPPMAIVVGAACAAALIVAKHHANIRRLLEGTESRVGKEASGQ